MFASIMCFVGGFVFFVAANAPQRKRQPSVYIPATLIGCLFVVAGIMNLVELNYIVLG